MISILIAVFLFGYLLIVLEHPIGINKTASALITGILCWVVVVVMADDKAPLISALSHHIAGISEILFFLLGAMTIVEVIDSHYGFRRITALIKADTPVRLMWILSIMAFFLSALLDNLTTAIVMSSLIRKMVKDRDWRLYMVSMVVIAANAGGAWSPIGDVTTTMLWVGGQISTGKMMPALFLPSLMNLLIPLVIVSFQLRRLPANLEREEEEPIHIDGSGLVLAFGIGGLLLVPVFKTLTHLPPYLGILLVLGLVWALTEQIHRKRDQEERSALTPGHALARIDTPSILFFLGILLAVGALESTHVLHDLATRLDSLTSSKEIIALLIGVASSIVDNVPLVAGAIGMYDLSTIPMDSDFWIFLAYTAGTGGSILIIGSAAGVAVMGMEKIDFLWYARKISFLAIAGYLAGAGTYLLLH